jgi:HAE1 family hydrophobic/amphiphilic exporter-1
MYTSQRLVVLQLQGIVVVQLLKLFKKWLLKNYHEDIDWAGISADEVSQGNQAIWVFLICLGLCLVLAAQKFYSALIRNSIITSGYIWCFPFAEVDRFRK